MASPSNDPASRSGNASRNKETGDHGEDLAAAYLEAQGFVVMDRNYRFEREEIDLIVWERDDLFGLGGALVFVEVKTRRGTGFGRPEAAVTPSKQAAIRRVAEAYLYERKLDSTVCRFDVVAVLLPPGRDPVIEHFRDAFGMEG
ncbi:MAG: YraN family protein [Bacteroidota bacterium]